MRKKILALAILILVIIFSLGCSISLVSEEEKEAKMQRREENFVLRNLKEKYGEEFVIAGYDPGGYGWSPDRPKMRAYPKEKGEEWTFDVELYQRGGGNMEDGYMLLYKYEDYKAYIKSFLEEMYGKDITLEDFKKDDRNVLPNTINKDTPVDEIGPLLTKQGPLQGIGARIGPIKIRLNEKILNGKSLPREAYRIAKAFSDRKIDVGPIYISVVNNQQYQYDRNFSKYYSPLMDSEKRLELNKEFFTFFSKHNLIYENPYYVMEVRYDRDKKKFKISDGEQEIEYWEE